MSDTFDHYLDAYLSRDEDDDEYEFGGVQRSTYKPKLITCRYCNKPNLHWVMSEGRWRLISKDKVLHDCRSIPDFKSEVPWDE